MVIGMKKYIFLMIMVGLFMCGCKTPIESLDEFVGEPIYEFEMIPDLGLQTVSEVMVWVADYVQYQSDAIHYPASEYWQSPAQTYVWRTGDCEDFSILAMYLIYRDVLKTPRMMAGTLFDDPHAWVEVDEQWWEPQEGVEVTDWPGYVVKYSVSYAEAIERSTTVHKVVAE